MLRQVHARLSRLAQTSKLTRHEPYELEIIRILQRLSRRPIDPTPESELLADLGFDSLQALELVGELEDRFDIAIPLNSLTHIRTVAQIAAEVSRLAGRGGVPS